MLSELKKRICSLRKLAYRKVFQVKNPIKINQKMSTLRKVTKLRIEHKFKGQYKWLPPILKKLE